MLEQNGIKKDFDATARDTAARLAILNLEAEKLSAATAGLHKKDKAGAGTDFHSFRPFESGIDNPRKIDWKASARRLDSEGNEIPLVRNREEEVSQTIYLLCDTGQSMDFRAPKDLFPVPPPYTKKETAILLTLTIAHLAEQAGESFTLLDSALNPGRGKKMIGQLMLTLAHTPDSAQKDQFLTLPTHRRKTLSHGSHIFVFSDFLSPLPEIAQRVDNLRRTGAKAHFIQILDPAEIEFRYNGHIALRGTEEKNLLTIKKGESAKNEIEQMIRNHIHAIDSMIKKIPGWHYSLHITDRPLHEALLPIYGLKVQSKAPHGGLMP